MPVKALITGGGAGLISTVRKYLDTRPRLCVDALIDSASQQPIPVTFGPGGGVAPIMISLYYNETIGALVAQSYRQVITYEIPEGYYGFLIRFTTFQDEAANSRVVTVLNMGTLDIITNTFILGVEEGNGYQFPQWTGDGQLEVTQAIGSANVTVTLEYTNEKGISGRSATAVIPKNSDVGLRVNPVLQGDDLGIQSVQNMSVAPTSTSGAVKMLGILQLGYHEDAGTNSYETLFAPGAVAFSSGSIIGLEFQGGSVSKARRFDLLLQLSKEFTDE
jgi:hypothetical protein